jgi:hypothetical protein
MAYIYTNVSLGSTSLCCHISFLIRVPKITAIPFFPKTLAIMIRWTQEVDDVKLKKTEYD